MRIIDTTGTNMQVRSYVGTNKYRYSLDGITWTDASFKKCLDVLTSIRAELENDLDECPECLNGTHIAVQLAR